MTKSELVNEYGGQYKKLSSQLLPTEIVMATPSADRRAVEFIGFYEFESIPGDARGREREVVWHWAIIGRLDEVLAEWETEPSLTDLLEVVDGLPA